MSQPANSARQPGQENIVIEVGLPARDVIRLVLDVKDGEIVSGSLTGVGCRSLLELFREWRPLLRGPLAELALPTGTHHAAILMREAILKAQGQWKFPYKEEELCHCRAVATAKVDAAIVAGCHTVDAVKAATSASTSCGTCRPDVESILAYRLKR